jgi:hypothetical protein
VVLPSFYDIDSLGCPFDAGWASADRELRHVCVLETLVLAKGCHSWINYAPMARRKLSDFALLKAIDRLHKLTVARRTANYIEGLLLQVFTRVKNNSLFPKTAWKGYKKTSKSWRWALVEVRRQEMRAIRKDLQQIRLSLRALPGYLVRNK